MGGQQFCSCVCQSQNPSKSGLSQVVVYSQAKEPQKSQTSLQKWSSDRFESNIEFVDQEETSKQMYVTLDDSWLAFMQQEDLQNNKDSINIFQIYEMEEYMQEDQPMNEIICKRVGEDFHKRQLLFSQNIPLEGIYSFEVKILSYVPDRRCEMAVGVVDYNQAKQSIQSQQINFEQSYFHSERNYDIPLEEENKPLAVNKKIQFVISRKEQDPHICFYLDGDLLRKENLRKELQRDKLIVPYIETQYRGLEFSWKSKKQEKVQHENKLSTILEEERGVSGVSQ